MRVENELEPIVPEEGVPRIRLDLFGFMFMLVANGIYFGILSLGDLGDAAGGSGPAMGTLFFVSGLITSIILLILGYRGRLVPRMLAPLSGAVLSAAMFALAIGEAGIGVPMTVYRTVAVGVGSADAIFFILWGELYSRVPPKKTLLHVAISFGIGSSAGILVREVLDPVASLIAAALFYVGSTMLMSRELHLVPYECGASHDDIMQRYRDALSFLWKPVVGGLLCAFITGLEWASTSSNMDQMPVAISIVTHLLVGFFLIALIHLPSRPFNLKLFYQVILPIVAILFLVTPFLSVPGNSVFSLVLMSVNSAGFALVDIALFSSMAIAVYVLDIPAAVPFGIERMLGALFMLAGIAGQSLTSDEMLRTLCAAVLALYVIAVVISIVRGNQGQLGESQNRTAATMEEKCAVIAKRYQLSPRETEVFSYLARGRGSTYISEELYLSAHTVKTHTKRIHEKLGVHSRDELLDLVEAEVDTAPQRGQMRECDKVTDS